MNLLTWKTWYELLIPLMDFFIHIVFFAHSEREMYQRLKSYILTEDQLKEHGFPFKDPETNAIMAIPNKKYSKDYSTDGNKTNF